MIPTASTGSPLPFDPLRGKQPCPCVGSGKEGEECRAQPGGDRTGLDGATTFCKRNLPENRHVAAMPRLTPQRGSPQ